MKSFVSIDLHIRTTGQLPFRSVPILLYGSPVTCLLCVLPEKSICIFCVGSVDTGSLVLPFDDSCHFDILSELMHAVHVLHLFSISFLIPDHQNTLLFASIFVESRCPKCSALTTCFFSSSEFTILSPAHIEPNCSICLLKNKETSSGFSLFACF